MFFVSLFDCALDGRKAFVLLVGYSDHHRLVGVNGGGKPNYEEGDFGPF